MFKSLKLMWGYSKHHQLLMRLRHFTQKGSPEEIKKILNTGFELLPEECEGLFMTLLLNSKGSDLKRAKSFELLFESQSHPIRVYDPKEKGIWACAVNNSSDLALFLIKKGWNANLMHTTELNGQVRSISYFELSMMFDNFEVAEVLWNHSQDSTRLVTETILSLLCRNRAIPRTWVRRFGENISFERKADMVRILINMNGEHPIESSKVFLTQLFEESPDKIREHLNIESSSQLSEWFMELEKGRFEETISKVEGGRELRKQRL